MSKPVDAWEPPVIGDRGRVKRTPHAFLWLLSLGLVLGLELWGLGGLELRDAMTPLTLAGPGLWEPLLALTPLILMNLLIVWVIKSWFTAMWVEGS